MLLTTQSHSTIIPNPTKQSDTEMADEEPDKQHKKPRPERSRHTRRLTTTRKKLLSAARAVFAERGLDLASIDEITRRADVGKGTFYYHFHGKSDLVGEVIKDVLDELAGVLRQRCSGATDLKDLLDRLIEAHIQFFCNRWEDFVLYFQGRTDLTLQEGYPGIETPFLEYLECVEGLMAAVLKYRLPQQVLRRIACAVAGFVSGYYSFAVVASKDEDIDEAFGSLRGAIVASLARVIQEAGGSETPAR
jgi:AcrR family transcriptional regulator